MRKFVETKINSHMKITIQEGKKYYSCDYSVNDKIDGGFQDEYFPPVNEAVDDVLDLLACVYDRKDIGNYLMTHIPAMDYASKPTGKDWI